MLLLLRRDARLMSAFDPPVIDQCLIAGGCRGAVGAACPRLRGLDFAVALQDMEQLLVAVRRCEADGRRLEDIFSFGAQDPVGLESCRATKNGVRRIVFRGRRFLSGLDGRKGLCEIVQVAIIGHCERSVSIVVGRLHLDQRRARRRFSWLCLGLIGFLDLLWMSEPLKSSRDGFSFLTPAGLESWAPRVRIAKEVLPKNDILPDSSAAQLKSVRGLLGRLWIEVLMM